MAGKVKAVVKTDYVTCRVQFTQDGVKLDFNPPWKKKTDKHHHDRDGYEKLVDGKRKAGSHAAGKKKTPKLANGRFDRNMHRHALSHERPTRLAFYVDKTTTWRFVNDGVAGKTAADKARFSRHLISPNGKVAEVTFTPEKNTSKAYGYELWLQADVVTAGPAGTERPSVTVIIDPIVDNDRIDP